MSGRLKVPVVVVAAAGLHRIDEMVPRRLGHNGNANSGVVRREAVEMLHLHLAI